MEYDTDRFWAKLAPDRRGWHPLIAHSADVGAVMQVLLEPGARFRRILARAGGLEDLSDGHVAQLVYLALLHDLGKVNHGFQDKGTEPPARRWPRTGHVKVVVESLTAPELRSWIATALLPLRAGDADLGELLLTAVCHHGRPWRPSGVTAPSGVRELWRPHPDHGRDPLAALRRLQRFAMWASQVTRDDAHVLPWRPLLSHELAGTLTLADWVGSSAEWFPFDPQADEDPHAYWLRARDNATRALRDVGLIEAPVVVSGEDASLLEKLFPGTFPANTPTPLQQAVVNMPLPEPGSRIVIESETGSGKTEAALTLYARLRAAGLADGLVFALPTRATARAMFDRVSRAVGNLYPDGRPVVALASRGTAGDAMTEGDIPEWNPNQIQEDDRDPAERRIPWATEHHKRFFAAEVVVGTVDQVLLAGLPVRHAHLRLSLLSRHLIVIDEVHSYDRYMASILRNLMDPLAQAGATVALLSATVSDQLKEEYAHGRVEVRSLEAAMAVPYPLLSVSSPSDGGWRETSVAGYSRAAKHLEWRTCNEPEALWAAVDAARSGASVLLLVNTVRDARRLVGDLAESDTTDLVWRPPTAEAGVAYHSRYTTPDRNVLDAAIQDRFGRPHAHGQGVGSILVATQVAEQSLDIDFDLLVSFIAPIDVLLQRVGRLHRHPEKARVAAFARACALVVVPDGAEQAAPDIWKGGRPHGWGEGSVYENLEDLEMTRRVIVDRPAIAIPRDNRALIELVYHSEKREALSCEPAWADVVSRGEGRGFAHRMHARDVALPFHESYVSVASVQAFGLERTVRTRLGDDSVEFVLESPVPCWYARAEAADRVHVPLRVLLGRRQHRPEESAHDGGLGEMDLRKPLPLVAESPHPSYQLPNGALITYTALGWDW